MATQVVKYTGDFGGVSAGTDGRSITLTGDALPQNAVIDNIAYVLNITAGGYSSSKKWCLHSFYLGNGSPSADYNEEYMSGTSGQLSGYMNFSQSDVSVFTGSVTLHAKANTTHSSTSYMREVTIAVEYHIAYNQSTSTLFPAKLDAGSTSTVNFSGDDLSNLYQTVTWAIGSYSYKKTTEMGAKSTSYAIPTEWINAITNSTEGTVSVTVETYSDSGLVGKSVLSLTVCVPSSVVPTISKITATRIDNSVPSSWGLYVQGKSGVKLTASGASGAYGSTITSYTFTGGAAATQTSNELTVDRIDQSGNVVFSVSATDSRGRTSASVSVTVSVQSYSSPTVTQAIAERCTSNGTVSEDGTYITAKINATYSSISGKNSMTVKCSYQKINDTTWTLALNSMSLDTANIIGSGGIDTNYSYRVKYELTDQFGTTEKIVSVGTASYIVFYRTDGTGVGIGKVCERDHAFEINSNWGFYYGDMNLIDKLNSIPNIVYSATQPTGAQGMIWLKPKG